MDDGFKRLLDKLGKTVQLPNRLMMMMMMMKVNGTNFARI